MQVTQSKTEKKKVWERKEGKKEERTVSLSRDTQRMNERKKEKNSLPSQTEKKESESENRKKKDR